MTIRPDINENEYRKTEKIDGIKCCFFEKIKNKDKPLAILTKRGGKKGEREREKKTTY